jgi:hypothetical protein
MIVRAMRARWRRAACSLLFVSIELGACSPSPAPSSISSRSESQRDPQIVDSHVHLAFYPVADQLAAHDVRAAVDLAAPERTLGTKYPIRVLQAGPMLTRPGGYPLNAWGADGYGIGCDTEECVKQTIARLQRQGAGVIKIAVGDDGLDHIVAVHAVHEAHRLGMKVVAHALSNMDAYRAATLGVDVLAHTPVEALTEQTIIFWSYQAPGQQRAVITTLAAFGGSKVAVDNLRLLREAGVRILYGTDLGNLRVDGPSTEEMELMKRAGMKDDEIRASMTTVPWHFWGFDAIEPR